MFVSRASARLYYLCCARSLCALKWSRCCEIGSNVVRKDQSLVECSIVVSVRIFWLLIFFIFESWCFFYTFYYIVCLFSKYSILNFIYIYMYVNLKGLSDRVKKNWRRMRIKQKSLIRNIKKKQQMREATKFLSYRQPFVKKYDEISICMYI